MRRSSVVGPLLLIGIGVWFLVSTLRPDLPLLDIAARFWPFVLIAWGALRLIEVLVWFLRGRALPSRGLSGGEWTLIVFLCLIGSGLYLVNYHHPWRNFGVISANRFEIFGHSYDYTVPECKSPAGKAARLLIENLHGNVRLTGVDAAEVVVNGHKSVRSLEERQAGIADTQSPVEISTQGDQVIVRTNQDRITDDQRVSTDLDVTVPRSLSVEVRGRNGDIEIGALNGGVEVSSDDAVVHLNNIGGNVRLDLRKSDLVRATNLKGAFEVDGGRGSDLELDNVAGAVIINGSYSGNIQLHDLSQPLRVQTTNTELRVERLPGRIQMDLGQLNGTDLVGPIHLTSTRSRDVELNQFTQSLDLAVDRGDITLRPAEIPLAQINARTRNGRIEIALPANAKYKLRALTNRGECDNQFGPALKTVPEEAGHPGHQGGSIAGSTGDGPSIVLQTDRGTITVRKDTGTALAGRQVTEPLEIEHR
jgi:DUF4097 and DUF4098 domain-containing protein YvlB